VSCSTGMVVYNSMWTVVLLPVVHYR